MNAKVKQAVQSEAQRKATTDTATGLPVIVPGTEPHEAALETARSEAEQYAASREFFRKSADKVMESVESLEIAVKAASETWWAVIQSLVFRCTPGNGKQFAREFDMLRQEIVDRMVKAEKFSPSPKADTLPKKYAELSKAHSGYGTLNTYASHTRQWFEGTKASADREQSAESFGKQVLGWIADRRESNKGTGTAKPTAETPKDLPVILAGDKDPETGEQLALTVGQSRAEIRVKDEETGTVETVTQNFTAPIIGAMARLAREIGHALHARCAPVDIVAILKTATDAIGNLKPPVTEAETK